MGLDVTAYSKLEYLQKQPETDEERDEAYESDAVRLYNALPYTRLDPQAEGFYAHNGDDFGVACGGYGRYNQWRDDLARLAGWPPTEYELYGTKVTSSAASAWKATSGPFWELINFSDCEGAIGAEVSKKLLADFTNYHASIAERAALMEGGADFMRRYEQWTNAFKLAADNGAVAFH